MCRFYDGLFSFPFPYVTYPWEKRGEKIRRKFPSLTLSFAHFVCRAAINLFYSRKLCPRATGNQRRIFLSLFRDFRRSWRHMCQIVGCDSTLVAARRRRIARKLGASFVNLAFLLFLKTGLRQKKMTKNSTNF